MASRRSTTPIRQALEVAAQSTRCIPQASRQFTTSTCTRSLPRRTTIIAPAPTPPRPAPPCLRRPFSTTPRHAFKTVEEAKSRYRSGPFSFRAGALFILSGGGLWYYFTYEKERMNRLRIAESHKGVGKPLVGGAFALTDQFGNLRTDKELMDDKFALVYFGFTHCPDICPEELDKMAAMVDLVYEKNGRVLTPVFITCDPARDRPEVMKAYLKEFHGSMVGLTGTYDEIKDVCKKYRVYFSTPRELKEGMDYLVDHSIYFYLMEGQFVEALGRQHTPEAAAKVINAHLSDWSGKLKADEPTEAPTAVAPIAKA